MRPRDLLEVAEHLVDAPSKRPKEAFLRRAVSSAYYAMFSCLCTCFADQLVGKTYKKAHPDIWAVAYRAINHGVTAEKLKSGKLGNVTSSQGVALFADELLDMREERMSADYDPNWRANKAGVRTSIRSEGVV